MKRVLFVCTGNTCRSPMAEALLRHLAEQEGFALEVQSAGVAAMDGAEMSQHAGQALQEKGINHDHRSRLVNRELLDWADIVLTMTEMHKQLLHTRFPSHQDKVYTLLEYVSVDAKPDKTDIPDPFGADLQVYRKCLDELEKHLIRLIKKWREET